MFEVEGHVLTLRLGFKFKSDTSTPTSLNTCTTQITISPANAQVKIKFYSFGTRKVGFDLAVVCELSYDSVQGLLVAQKCL